MEELFEKIRDPTLKFPTPTVENIHLLPLGSWLPLLTTVSFPVLFSLGYTVVVQIWKSFIKKPAEMSPIFRFFVVAHNLLLCVFSAVTFAAMFPRLLLNYKDRPFLDAWCDNKGKLWDSGLGYWTWLFYLSKYYEVVDTLILLLKGKKPSLLQSYHHAGAILCLWAGTIASGTAIWLFVIFNSFVHTIMYFYYALTTVGIKPPGKKYLTSLQITQFVVGGALGTSFLFIPNCLRLVPGLELYEYGVHIFIISYLVPLTFLFLDFSKAAYGKSQKAKQTEAAKKKKRN